MVAMNKYTMSYARSFVTATIQDQLADGYKPKAIKGLSTQQIALMAREQANLEREFRIAEQSYGTDQLDLILATATWANFRQSRVVPYLAQHHREIRISKLVEVDAAAA